MTRVLITLLSMIVVGSATAQVPVDTAFTYQGRIKSDQAVVNSLCDFEFTLWRDATSNDPGDQVGPTVPKTLLVTNGLFTTLLDFGAEFAGDARWLQIRVRCPAGAGVFSTVTPRQELTGTPYAMHALSAAGWEQNSGNTVLADGRVGIGILSPEGGLDVRQAAENVLRGINVKNNAATQSLRLWVDPNDVRRISGGSNEAGDIVLNGTGSGRVGIGTTTPLFRFHVNGGIMTDGQIEVHQTDDAVTRGLGVFNAAGDSALRLWVDGSSRRRISGGTGGDGDILLNASGAGRVGIGLAVPSCALDVDGSVCSNGSPLSSDRRLKRDIEPISDALDLVSALDGVRYTWRDDEFPDRRLKHGRDLGFIAQDVHEVLPDAVMIRDDGYYALDYTRVVPVAVEAIKDLSAQNRDYEARLRAQEDRNMQLEERLVRLEALLSQMNEGAED